MRILISACLLGINTRYDGKAIKLNLKTHKLIKELLKNHEVIPVCPEQLGGLPTPRPPAMIKGKKIINQLGEDVTANFRRGAQEVLKIAQLLNIKYAYFKGNSPSCGEHGITSKILKKHHVKLYFL
ncbi:MAG: DUF523 domain-containing protein [candidate division WOR-3 bacterium]|nr:DUF523 domain-containing protein [candidate division WOR-3 bacterium]MCX7757787.1 DUF523 domain-containing protein [candidate division WOR-3 bacterium]MDW7987501.1 DUF523 domain-containing protein [candidate division WOR-3 bacterium]